MPDTSSTTIDHLPTEVRDNHGGKFIASLISLGIGILGHRFVATDLLLH